MKKIWLDGAWEEYLVWFDKDKKNLALSYIVWIISIDIFYNYVISNSY